MPRNFKPLEQKGDPREFRYAPFPPVTEKVTLYDMNIEEQYADVLQNIEYAIISVYREHPDISDKSVLRVLNETIDHFVDEKQGREPKGVYLPENSGLMYERVNEVCQLRLGRISQEDELPVTPVSIDEIIACLKRIRKSVKMWRKERGKQVYLNHVSNFIK